MSGDAPLTARSVWGRRLSYIAFFVVGYSAWKADVFWNYYQFKKLCAAEGGLNVFEPLKKGVGWETVWPATSVSGSMSYASQMPNVAFFRVKRTEYDPLPELGIGVPIDVRYLGGPPLPRGSYEFKPSDLSKAVVYQIVTDVQRERNDRISRFLFEVREVGSQKVMLRSTQFRFNWRTIPIWHWLGPTGQTGCPLAGYKLQDISQVNQVSFKN